MDNKMRLFFIDKLGNNGTEEFLGEFDDTIALGRFLQDDLLKRGGDINNPTFAWSDANGALILQWEEDCLLYRITNFEIFDN